MYGTAVKHDHSFNVKIPFQKVAASFFMCFRLFPHSGLGAPVIIIIGFAGVARHGFAIDEKLLGIFCAVQVSPQRIQASPVNIAYRQIMTDCCFGQGLHINVAGVVFDKILGTAACILKKKRFP